VRRFYKQTDTGVTEFVAEDEKVYARHHTDHARANRVMARNRELQRNQGAIRTTSFGKLELDIPLTHLKMLDQFFPGIADPAHPDHKWQLRKFMKSPVSDPYRLQERKRGVNRGTHIKI
jgi:hypothetical protein